MSAQLRCQFFGEIFSPSSLRFWIGVKLWDRWSKTGIKVVREWFQFWYRNPNWGSRAKLSLFLKPVLSQAAQRGIHFYCFHNRDATPWPDWEHSIGEGKYARKRYKKALHPAGFEPMTSWLQDARPTAVLQPLQPRVEPEIDQATWSTFLLEVDQQTRPTILQAFLTGVLVLSS